MLRGFSNYRMILYSLLIIVLMLARPQGLFSFIGGPKAKA
jgi:ABC-type branched-subunit amino acid transport system permease subunit